MSYRDSVLEIISELYSLEELERLGHENVFHVLNATTNKLKVKSPMGSTPLPRAALQDEYKRGFKAALTTIRNVVDQQIAQL